MAPNSIGESIDAKVRRCQQHIKYNQIYQISKGTSLLVGRTQLSSCLSDCFRFWHAGCRLRWLFRNAKTSWEMFQQHHWDIISVCYMLRFVSLS